MKELLDFYTRTLAGFAVTIAASVVLVPHVVLPFLISKLGPNHWVISAANLLTSRFAIVLILALGAYLIQKWLWKLKHSELNFDGEWEGETFYTHVWLGSADVPFKSKHKARIEQDCLHFMLAPTTGEQYVNWGSLAANLIDKNTIRYAYWVKYSDRNRFPAEVIGYEEMRVIARGSMGRPEELSGNFYHCVQESGPIYSGTVIFRRKRRQGFLNSLRTRLLGRRRK